MTCETHADFPHIDCEGCSHALFVSNRAAMIAKTGRDLIEVARRLHAEGFQPDVIADLKTLSNNLAVFSNVS